MDKGIDQNTLIEAVRRKRREVRWRSKWKWRIKGKKRRVISERIWRRKKDTGENRQGREKNTEDEECGDDERKCKRYEWCVLPNSCFWLLHLHFPFGCYYTTCKQKEEENKDDEGEEH